MKGASRRALERRRALLGEELAQKLTTGTPQDTTQSLAEELKQVDDILARFPRRPRPWLPLFSTAAVCMALLALAQYWRFDTTNLTLDAIASELQIGNEGSLTATAPRFATISQGWLTLPREGQSPERIPIERGAVGQLALAPHAALRIAFASTAGCYRLDAEGGVVRASLGLSMPGADGVEKIEQRTIELRPRQRAELCGVTRVELVLGPSLALRLDRMHAEQGAEGGTRGSRQIYLPALVSGTLGQRDLGRERQLRNTERIQFAAVSDGNLIVSTASTDANGALRVIFDGKSARPVVSGPAGHEDLRPTLLEYLRASPVLSFLTGAFVALWGVAWPTIQRVFVR